MEQHISPEISTENKKMTTIRLSTEIVVVALLTGLMVVAGAIALPAQGQVAHNTWTAGTAMPKAVTYGAAAALKANVYVVGGNDAPGHTAGGIIAYVQIYDPLTQTWSMGVPYPTPIEAASAAVVKGVLYVFGGSTDASTPTNAVWAFSTKKKTWTAMAPMPTARWATQAIVQKKTNIIFVIGGDVNTSGNGNTASVESYNPATNTWTKEAPMLVAKGQSAAGLIGTKIVVADGFTNGGGTTGDTEVYDPTANTWTTVAPNAAGNRGASCSGAIGTKLIDVGGANAPNITESFLLSKNKWTTTLAAIPQPIYFPASAVYKGQLYCMGGWPSWLGTPQDNVQIYKP